MRCIILTGEIKTGKTTSLFKLLPKISGVTGVLQPVVEGRRFLYCISSRQLLAFETDASNSEPVQIIGKYHFLQSGFDAAIKHILEHVVSANTVIVDEVGPLEMGEKGLFEAIQMLCKTNRQNLRIVFVVRVALLDAFTRQFLTPNGIVPEVVSSDDTLSELLQGE